MCAAYSLTAPVKFPALTGCLGALLRVEIRLTHINSREAANAGTGKESEARWSPGGNRPGAKPFSVGLEVDARER